jgi:PAS domain-containing protein
MNPQFNPQHLILLFGGAVLVISIVLLAVYFLQKSLGRSLKAGEPKAAKVRVEDEAAFGLATLKAVITQLKADQKAAQEKLVVAERRAEESARKFELLAREIEYGLIVFDTEGFITFSNPLVRQLLAVDTWSRRRYGEIFQNNSPLSQLIAACFETGTETRKKTVEVQGDDESKRRVEVSVLPTRDRSGAMEVVACIFREVPPPVPAGSPLEGSNGPAPLERV